MLKNKKSGYIAIIDSGLGGLSVVKRIKNINKEANILYFADNKFMPYGDKSVDFLRARLSEIIEFLMSKYDVKMIILACNTASTSAMDFLREKFQIRIFGVTPKTYPNSILFCTPRTKSNLKFQSSIDLKDLATLIEKDYFNKDKLKAYIKNIEIDKKFSSIILGCTHYELIADIFQEIFEDIKIICPSCNLIEEIKPEILKMTGDGEMKINLSNENKDYLKTILAILNDV